MRSSIEGVYQNFENFMNGDEGRIIHRYMKAQRPPGFRHQLGAWVILYTPFSKRPPLMIVGNSPSWFDDKSNEAALRNLNDVAARVPFVNSYLVHNHAYARQLQDALILSLNRRDLLENCVGLNRFWIQTGADVGAVRPKRTADPAIQMAWKQAEKLCEEGMRRIIDLARPRAVALVGDPASEAVPADFRSRRASHIVFRDCRHPAYNRVSDFTADISELIVKAAI